jgi:hypothetical protein
LRQAAREAGFSYTTLKRAKTDLDIEAEQKWIDGRNCWFWRLPDSLCPEPLSWPEQHQRALAQAQKESDDFMARIREKFVHQYRPPTDLPRPA